MKRLFFLCFCLFLLSCSQTTEPEPEENLVLVLGEFQDADLLEQAMGTQPELADWSTKDMYDGATGATLQTKTLEYDVPARHIYLQDSLLATADVWGQFWFELEPGAYELRATCQGYQDEQLQLDIPDEERMYLMVPLWPVAEE